MKRKAIYFKRLCLRIRFNTREQQSKDKFVLIRYETETWNFYFLVSIRLVAYLDVLLSFLRGCNRVPNAIFACFFFWKQTELPQTIVLANARNSIEDYRIEKRRTRFSFSCPTSLYNELTLLNIATAVIQVVKSLFLKNITVIHIFLIRM